MTSSGFAGHASFRSDAVWTHLSGLLDARSLSPERVLCKLGSLWHAAMGRCAVCVVSSAEDASEVRFLVVTDTTEPTVADVDRQPLPAGAGWVEVVPGQLPDDFGDFEVVRFRTTDHRQTGGVLVAADEAIGDDDFIHTLRLLSARALADAVAQPSSESSLSPVEQRALDPDRLSSLAEFAAGAGHEINNPLGTIIGRVQLLLRGESDLDRRQSLSTIGGQAYRIRDMIGDVMLFARPAEPDPEWNQLADVIEEVLNGNEDVLAAAGFEADVEFSGALRVYADPVQLRVALAALVRNAVEAISDGRSPELRVRAKQQGGSTVVSVSDNGCGFTEEQRRHMFDPFYSGRQAGRGLGFGLSKCWRIVSNHGGTIRFREQDGWTTFQLSFPDSPD